MWVCVYVFVQSPGRFCGTISSLTIVFYSSANLRPNPLSLTQPRPLHPFTLTPFHPYTLTHPASVTPSTCTLSRTQFLLHSSWPVSRCEKGSDTLITRILCIVQTPFLFLLVFFLLLLLLLLLLLIIIISSSSLSYCYYLTFSSSSFSSSSSSLSSSKSLESRKSYS